MIQPLGSTAPAIDVDGRALQASFMQQLTGLRVHQRLSLPSQCEISFSDPDGALQRSGLLGVGRPILIRAPGSERELFRGEVTGMESEFSSSGGAQLHVRGYDALHRLATRQHVRAFVRASLAEIASQLTSDLGITVQVDGVDAAWDHVIQHRQTDLQFLVELAQRRGLCLFLSDQTLKLFGLDKGLAHATAWLGKDVLELRLSRNALVGARAVSVVGWNARTARAVNADAASGPVPQHLSGVGGQEAMSPRTLTNHPVDDERDAAGIAALERDYQAAAGACATGLVGGRPDIHVGSMLTIDGLTSGSSGPYALCAVKHIMRPDSGYVTEFDSQPAKAPTEPSSNVSLTLGIVVRTDDPSGTGRVQLMLPAFGDISTDWVKTLSACAGKGKGLMAQPDIDDRVVFVFFQSDPAQGVVIGSVYGDDESHGQWVKDALGRQRYNFVTPGGHCAVLDDSTRSVRIESAGGSYVELGPERMTLHAATDLRIEAPGKTLVLAGNKIDFERT